jgi:isopentenyldiphosphate isomerase
MPEPQDDSFAPQPDTRRQTLDDPDELFDLVDRDDRVIGQVRRGDAHRNPALIHRSVQILVFARDGSVLLQRRSAAKDLFPGYLCASASGHVASGEDYATTAQRELAEELGLSSPLIYIGKALIRSEPETEITALYVTQSDGPYHFHPTETAGGMLVTMSEVWDGAVTNTLPMTPALRVAITELMRRVEQAGDSLAAFLANLANAGGYGV